ncbi:hypothetical protein D3OALGA1CA_974 [Olavius algarvensis associated proteobacterium Delta 3]|nr:hypothetical protein D3OALGA1CA_974 [Olavius algarvensis associated proteobacterium Delta 3]CAB5130057.1 hypothetical protein D3OALGB2SA_3561 [Olavius algarvensis associated proteobacterium Delta 3]
MRYFLYLLGFGATLIAVLTSTRGKPDNGRARMTRTGIVALLLGFLVMLFSILGTWKDQTRIKQLLHGRAPVSGSAEVTTQQ